jgi:hypothetical protein
MMGEGYTTDGPLGDVARAALEGHPGTMTGRFQGQEENVQAIPREMTLGELRRAQAPLRGQTSLLASIDDNSWGTNHTDTPEMPVEEKAQKCRDLAEFLCRYMENTQEVIDETAIDLMPIPAMNLERIHKRLGMDVVNACLKVLEGSENDPPPKPLTRFQILKKE